MFNSRFLAVIVGTLVALGCAWLTQAQVPMTGGGVGAPTASSHTVLFDVSSFTANPGVSPVTFTPINIGSGSNGTANRALIVYVAQRTGALGVVSATWNGVAMSSIGTDGADTFLGLVAPATGTNSLVVTYAGGGTISVACLSVVGADQTGGATTFHDFTTTSQASVNPHTVTMPSANGEISFAGFISSGTAYTATGAGTTDIGNATGSNGDAANWRSAVGATTTLTYTLTTANSGIASGVSIKAQ